MRGRVEGSTNKLRPCDGPPHLDIAEAPPAALSRKRGEGTNAAAARNPEHESTPMIERIPTRAAIVCEARSWIGTPYRHQASLKGVGCDCLGLIRGVWRALYGDEPEAVLPYTPDWAEAGKREILAETAARHLTPVALEQFALWGRACCFAGAPALPSPSMRPSSRNAVASVPPVALRLRRMVHAHDGAAVAEIALAPWWRGDWHMRSGFQELGEAAPEGPYLAFALRTNGDFSTFERRIFRGEQCSEYLEPSYYWRILRSPYRPWHRLVLDCRCRRRKAQTEKLLWRKRKPR